jgi:hypothetical protein
LWMAALRAVDGANDCTQMRLFVSGGNVMNATKHDLNAIGGRPDWGQLNYDGIAKSRNWIYGDPRCDGLTGGSTGMDCDEYPFNKTEQGGQANQPSLLPVPLSENRSQGGSFGNGPCSLQGPAGPDAHGTPFLVVPIPVVGVPTRWLCNGG